jgi:hypothetical protein
MRKAAIAIIAALLVTFAALAYLAVASKAPTYDEPLHALGAWQHLHLKDFRVNPEDPPLWQYWAALPNGRGAIRADTTSKIFDDVATDIDGEWNYTVETLFRTAGNDGDTFIMRSRRMMLIIALALGVVVAWWSWKLAGPVAAVVATMFFALDPNILGHAPLVKNDISLTLITVALACAIWCAGKKVTIWNTAAFTLLCAAAVTTKFSGLFLGPIAALMLIIRALFPAPWPVFKHTLDSLSTRLAAAVGLCVAAAIVSYFGIWAAYGFRFTGTPNQSIRFGWTQMMIYTATADITRQRGVEPTDPEIIRQWKPTFVPTTLVRMYQSRVLPEAWLYGLLYTYQSALARKTYLLGEYSWTGWWYYFPLTIVYKSPLTLLLCGAVAAAMGYNVYKHRDPKKRQYLNGPWKVVCLATPPLIYLLIAMRSNINLGLRHVLPIFPFLYIGLGLAAARIFALKPAVARRWFGVIFLALAAETALAFPNFIAFFNAAAGGSRGGLDLLGDSNLDWGQDLRLLSEWRQKHSEGQLYLIYFGLADPWYYGIDEYVNLPSGYKFGPVPPKQIPMTPGTLAVSATMLQGIYGDDTSRMIFHTLRTKAKPKEVLGGTIYLYDWPIVELPLE